MSSPNLDAVIDRLVALGENTSSPEARSQIEAVLSELDVVAPRPESADLRARLTRLLSPESPHASAAQRDLLRRLEQLLTAFPPSAPPPPLSPEQDTILRRTDLVPEQRVHLLIALAFEQRGDLVGMIGEYRQAELAVPHDACARCLAIYVQSLVSSEGSDVHRIRRGLDLIRPHLTAVGVGVDAAVRLPLMDAALACVARGGYWEAANAFAAAGARAEVLALGSSRLRAGDWSNGTHAYVVAGDRPPADALVECGDACVERGDLVHATCAYQAASATEQLLAIADRHLARGEALSAKIVYDDLGLPMPPERALHAARLLAQAGNVEVARALYRQALCEPASGAAATPGPSNG